MKKTQKYDCVICGDCQFGFIGLSVVIGGSMDRIKNDFVVVYVMFVHRSCVSFGECHTCAKHFCYDKHCVMILRYQLVVLSEFSNTQTTNIQTKNKRKTNLTKQTKKQQKKSNIQKTKHQPNKQIINQQNKINPQKTYIRKTHKQ